MEGEGPACKRENSKVTRGGETDKGRPKVGSCWIIPQPSWTTLSSRPRAWPCSSQKLAADNFPDSGSCGVLAYDATQRGEGSGHLFRRREVVGRTEPQKSALQ